MTISRCTPVYPIRPEIVGRDKYNERFRFSQNHAVDWRAGVWAEVRHGVVLEGDDLRAVVDWLNDALRAYENEHSQ